MTTVDPKTVAIVSTQPFWHGGETQAQLLAEGLRQRGIRCLILARRGGEFARRMAQSGFDVVEFAGRGWNLGAVVRLRRALRHFRPDVLHYNDSHAMNSAGLASLGLSIPLRVMARRVDFPIHSARRYRWFCDAVFCVSNAVARACRDGGLPPAMLRVVHDGVDPSRGPSGDRRRGRQSLGLADDSPLLLVVAKMTDHKGHRFLLDAMPDVLARYPRAVLALAGDGELLDVLQEQARRLNIASSVRFLGYRDDVPDLIRAADVIVQPSHMEGLCSTLIDAMFAQQTIVASAAGGITDLLLDGVPNDQPVAWTVPPRDPAALARAIVDALDASPDRQAQRQRRACQRAESLFTADCMVESTLAAYRTWLQRRRSD
ncbi:MAG: glycosyltransferase [Planctomycetaceae bacterium]|nr:glycosyltransferase [Planctomycetaceae bacterium]